MSNRSVEQCAIEVATQASPDVSIEELLQAAINLWIERNVRSVAVDSYLDPTIMIGKLFDNLPHERMAALAEGLGKHLVGTTLNDKHPDLVVIHDLGLQQHRPFYHDHVRIDVVIPEEQK